MLLLLLSYARARTLAPLLPLQAGGRDGDDLERRLAVAWKQPAPAKSVVTRLLERNVHAYQRRVRNEQAAVRAAMVGQGGSSSSSPSSGASSAGANDNISSGGTSGTSSGSSGAGKHTGFAPEDLSAPQLSPWEVSCAKRAVAVLLEPTPPRVFILSVFFLASVFSFANIFFFNDSLRICARQTLRCTRSEASLKPRNKSARRRLALLVLVAMGLVLLVRLGLR